MKKSLLKSGDEAIQMEPVPHTSRKPSTWGLPLQGLHKLEILKNYEKFYLDYQVGNCYGQLFGGESETLLFTLERTQAGAGPAGRAGISDSLLNFMDQTGRIVFRSFRSKFQSHVECGDLALGSVKGGEHCCGRTFTVTTSTDMVFSLIPTGFCGQRYMSCCNSCFLDEYIILNENDQKVGSIRCGGKIEIELDPSLSVPVKTLLLAASMLVFELYFAPCFGNVGEMGSRYLLACVLIGVPIIFIAVIYLIVKLNVNVDLDGLE